MAENDNPGSQASDQNKGADGAGGAAPPARPDFIPEKYWDPKNPLPAEVLAHPTVVNLAKGYGEAQTFIGKGRDGLKAEIEAERVKGRPAKPEEYAFKLPQGAPADLVILDKAPATDFKPEAGKKYFVVDPKDPLLGFWRKHAFDTGLSNDQFMAGVMQYAQASAGRQPSEDDIKAARAAEWQKLGENGEQRAQHAWGRLVGVLGEERAKALEESVSSAGAIEAVELLLEKAGEPKFSAGGGGGPAGGVTLEGLQKLQGEADYWSNPEKQKQVAEGYKRLYPGQVQTAALDRRRA